MIACSFHEILLLVASCVKENQIAKRDPCMFQRSLKDRCTPDFMNDNSLLVFRERPLYSFGYDPYEKNSSNRADLLKSACKTPPQVCRFSQICHWTATYMCLQKFPPPSLQIFQNLPLDSYLSYLHMLTEIPPHFADFPKSPTGQLPKLPTCACRNSPQLQIFSKSATLCRFTEFCMQKFPSNMCERHCG